MTTFTVEIHEDIVTWLKKSSRPEIVLDLPSVPAPGDKLWLKSMRGTHIVKRKDARSWSRAAFRACARLYAWYWYLVLKQTMGTMNPANRTSFEKGVNVYHSQRSFVGSERKLCKSYR